MPNTAKVTTGKPKVAGAVYRAPIGTTLPTDASTALAAAFEDMGYISEDGITNSNSPDSEKIKFLESLNEDVLETVYGVSNVTVGSNTITVVANASALGEYIYVIDMVMTGGALKRIVIPKGSLSELGDIVYKSNEAVGYEVTLEALPDSSGNTHYEYIKTA